MERHALPDRYIHFYNHARVQNKTGAAPLTQRRSAYNLISSHMRDFWNCPYHLGAVHLREQGLFLCHALATKPINQSQNR